MRLPIPAWVAAGVTMLVLCSCSYPLDAPDEPAVDTIWELGLDGDGVVIASDPRLTFLSIKREALLELVALNTVTGKSVWNQTFTDDTVISSLGDKIIATVDIQEGVQMVALSQTSGEIEWTKTFAKEPVAIWPEGSFVIQMEDGALRSADLGGANLATDWRLDDGCEISGGAGDPQSHDVYIGVQCEGELPKIITLDSDLLQTASTPAEQYQSLSETSVVGNFVVFLTYAPGPTFVYTRGELVYRGQESSGAKFTAQRADLRMALADGDVTLIDPSGDLIPPSTDDFVLAESAVNWDHDLVRYSYFHPQTSSPINSEVRVGSPGELTALANGSGMLEAINDDERHELRLLSYTRRPVGDSPPEMTFLPSTIDLGDRTIGLDLALDEDDHEDTNSIRFFDTKLGVPLGTVSVVQLRTAKIAKDAVERHISNLENDDDGSYFALGRCFVSVETRSDPDPEAVAAVAAKVSSAKTVGGCGE